jgi:hypothetical protein
MARPVVPALLFAAAAACDSTGPRVPPPCLAPVVEFTPTDCAVLTGRLMGPTGVLAAHGVVVDSAVALVGLAYSSDPARTSPEGEFTLTVYRVTRFALPTDPDTASVEVKVFTDPDRAAGGRTPDARGFVRLLFARAGAVADTTRVDVSVGIGESGGGVTRSCC